jgi:hypothetical protein
MAFMAFLAFIIWHSWHSWHSWHLSFGIHGIYHLAFEHSAFAGEARAVVQSGCSWRGGAIQSLLALVPDADWMKGP